MDWISSAAQGILLGGFYALLAAGLSFMFGVMRIVNLAHGASAVLGGYLALVLTRDLEIPWFVVLLLVVPLMAIGGYALQVGLLNRALRQPNGLAPILVTFGVSVVLSSLLQELFSADTQSIQLGELSQASIRLTDGLAIGVLPLITFAVGVLVIVGLQLFLSRTRYGRAMRATSDDQDTARLVGIDSRRIYAVAAAIAMGTLGIAGVFLGVRTQFSPTYGDLVLIFAFEAVIIGGLGSLWGTLAGGVILGLAQTLGSQALPGYGVLIGHVVFLVILAFRPTGLFQKAVQA